jgi:riboflavin kinase / FMN adenylyltransferase
LKVFQNIDESHIANPVATIGIFDGVHQAHRSIINKLNNAARRVGGESVIVTLWPHPRIVLNGDNRPMKLINTLEEKIDLLDSAGVDNLVVLDFNKDFALTTFERFVQNILYDKLGIRHLVVGFNHQFGKNREGNFDRLKELSESLGFEIEQLEPVFYEGERISSSAIRKLLTEGLIEKANKFLGYGFFISGKVTVGNKLGRRIGFPTANIALPDPYKIIPGNGVYAVEVIHENRPYKGMMNIGYRPTIEALPKGVVLEVNLFDYSGDLYSKELKIIFHGKIREEQKFASLEALKEQISRDKMSALKILRSLKND